MTPEHHNLNMRSEELRKKMWTILSVVLCSSTLQSVVSSLQSPVWSVWETQCVGQQSIVLERPASLCAGAPRVQQVSVARRPLRSWEQTTVSTVSTDRTLDQWGSETTQRSLHATPLWTQDVHSNGGEHWEIFPSPRASTGPSRDLLLVKRSGSGHNRPSTNWRYQNKSSS